MSNSLDPDQDQQNVGPVLGQNCQKMTKVVASKERGRIKTNSWTNLWKDTLSTRVQARKTWNSPNMTKNY